MASLRSLLSPHRYGAAAAWALTVALVVPLATRDPPVTVPAELLAVVTLPVVVRAAGTSLGSHTTTPPLSGRCNWSLPASPESPSSAARRRS